MQEIFDKRGSYHHMFRRLSQTSSLNFLSFEEIVALHDYLIDEYGGMSGFRDEGVLHSIVDKVRSMEEYYNTGNVDLYDLAASYIWEISTGHPFSDANKRTSLAVALTFLSDNGVTTKFDPVGLELLARACAAASMEEGFYGEYAYSFSYEKAREMLQACRIGT